MDFVAYSAFLKKRAKDFRSIAARTKGGMSAEDLHGEAWLVADHLSAKRGEAIDWSDSEDQSLIFGVLTVQHVTRQKSRYWHESISIDEKAENDDGGVIGILERLSDKAAVDPLEALATKDDPTDIQLMLATSYSQATAYVIICIHFGGDRESICAHLVITYCTWYRRLDSARSVVKFQSSLFDRIEKIDETFMPAPGREYAAKIERHCAAEQWGWEF
jgi:hypothetical protein